VTNTLVVDELDPARTITYTTDVTGVGVEQLNVIAGDGDDMVNVRSVAVPTFVELGTGSDTLKAGSLAPDAGGTLSLVAAALTASGDADDLLQVDVTGDGRNIDGVLSATSLTGVGMIGRVDYTGFGTFELNLGDGANGLDIESTHAGLTRIDTGADDDVVRVRTISGSTLIYTRAGDDIVTLADDSDTLNGFTRPLFVNTGDGSDVLAIDASGDDADLVGMLEDNRFIGFGADQQISFAGVERLTIASGAGDDMVTVIDTPLTETEIDTGAGADRITVRSVSGETAIDAGSGADTVLVTSTAGLLDQIVAHLDVGGGLGPDELTVAADGDAAGLMGTLESTRITGLGMSADITYTTFETLAVVLGSGADTFTVADTHAGATNLVAGDDADTVNVQSIGGDTTVDGGAGDDTVNVFDTVERLGGIDAVLSVLGNDGADRLDVRDRGSSEGRVGSLNATTITGLGMGGQIDYDGFTDLVIRLGSGADQFTIDSTHTAGTTLQTDAGDDVVTIRSNDGDTAIETGAGSDTISVGDASRRVQSVSAALAIDGGTDHDTLTVDNSGDSIDRTGTLTAMMINGLGMGGPITYVEVDALSIILGSARDTFEIRSTHTSATTVNAAAGNDVLIVRSVDGLTTVLGAAGDDSTLVMGVDGRLAGLAARLVVKSGSGLDTLTTSNVGSLESGMGTLSSVAVTGFGIATPFYYGEIERLTLTLGGAADDLTVMGTHGGFTQINAGGGDDVLHVRTVSGLTNIDLGAGADRATVASDADQLLGIHAQLNITGGTGADQLDLRNAGESFGRVGVLTDSTLTGLGMIGSIAYDSIDALWIYLGSGDDLLTVESTHDRWTRIEAGTGDDQILVKTVNGQTTLALGDGGDLAIVTNDALRLTGIASNLAILGQGGIDGLIADASGDLVPLVGSIRSDQLSGLGMTGQITYLTVESLIVRLGAGDDVLTVESTHAFETTIDAAAGNDAIAVRSVDGPTTVNAGLGDDTVTISAADQTVQAIGSILGVGGEEGADTLIVDNSGDDQAGSGQLTDELIAGFGMPGSIGYTGFEMVSLSLGGGTDQLLVAGTHLGTTSVATGGGGDVVSVQAVLGSTTIDLGSGDDTAVIANVLMTIQTIAAPLSVIGGSDIDQITIDNSGDILGRIGTLSESSLTGIGMPGRIDYGAFETIMLGLGLGDDELFVSNTHLGLTTIEAGPGDDVVDVSGVTGLTGISGGDGVDTLIGDAISTDWTILEGGVGGFGNLAFTEFENLTITGDPADNVFTFVGNASIDFVLDGGGGYDTIDFTQYATPVTVNLATGATTATGGIASIERIIGSTFNDALTAANTTNTWQIVGPDAGNINGPGVFDFISFENLIGGQSADDVSFAPEGTVSGTFRGAQGRDTLDYSLLGEAVVVDMPSALGSRIGGGLAGRLFTFENVIATNFDDELIGDAADNEFTGLAGNDIIIGAEGNDVISDGAGNDQLDGGIGNDTYIILPSLSDIIVDAAGNDTIDFQPATFGVRIDLRKDNGQRQRITDGDEELYVTGAIENALGGEFDDHIIGSNVANELNGRGGADTIEGLGGDDLIRGGDGDDDIDGGQDNDRIFGQLGADRIRGRQGDDFIQGHAGADDIRGDGGSDRIEAGADDDEVRGGSGDDVLLGNAGNDTIRGEGGHDLLSGNEGNDVLSGGPGRDTVTFADALDSVAVELDLGVSAGATEGLDQISQIENVIGSRFGDFIAGDNGSNELSGGLGDDLIEGRGGSDFIAGDAGDDTLRGEAGSDTLEGNAGSDILLGGDGNDELAGGDGDDILSGDSGNEQFIWDASEGNDTIEGGDGRDNVLVTTSDAADQITLAGVGDAVVVTIVDPAAQLTFRTVEDFELNAGDGDDVVDVQNLVGSGLDKTDVHLGPGDDRVNTTIAGAPITIEGEEGDDTLLGGAGDVEFDGGDGQDAADYSASASPINADVGAGRVIIVNTGARDRLRDVEIYIGSVFADQLEGSGKDDTIYGGAGDDFIRGRGGDDLLFGDAGDDELRGDGGFDRLRGGLGSDALDGGPGNSIDYADYTVAPAGVDVDLAMSTGEDGQGGIDTYQRIDGVLGSSFDDVIRGDDRDNALFGGDGDDVIRGGDGDDLIDGNAGADELHGELGNDTILSQYPSGDDRAYGGAGSDLLRYVGSVFQSDQLTVGADDGWIVIERTNPEVAVVSSIGVEMLSIETGGGDDAVTIESLLSTDLITLTLDLGDGNVITGGPGDTFTFTG
jgi:Ca2+-binding RTX toxin-like protein